MKQRQLWPTWDYWNNTLGTSRIHEGDFGTIGSAHLHRYRLRGHGKRSSGLGRRRPADHSGFCKQSRLLGNLYTTISNDTMIAERELPRVSAQCCTKLQIIVSLIEGPHLPRHSVHIQ